jgi:predicted short-subunit dehydrogenase-like oxidoreductase (DUF2520 family)
VAVKSAQTVADRCDLVLLTVPDDAIAEVASSVQWKPGQAVVHCSGATPLSSLEPAAHCGALIGAFHPLQTFADAEQPPSILEEIAFAVEAAPPLLGDLQGMARDLGGWPIELDGRDRALYHISAVVVCGFVATLMQAAAGLWERFEGTGAEGADQGLRALLPLARRTIESIGEGGLPEAMTGPLTRGDVGTVRLHLDALATADPEFRRLYRHLALATLPMARAKGGLDPGRERELESLLREAMEPVGVS